MTGGKVRLDPDSLRDLLRYEAASYAWFDRLGIRYKVVGAWEFAPTAPCPVWRSLGPTSGLVVVPPCPGRHFGWVAHELGHGAHERLRDDARRTGRVLPAVLREDRGEHVAEAVRFFVERSLGGAERVPRLGDVLEAVRYDEDALAGLWGGPGV